MIIWIHIFNLLWFKVAGNDKPLKMVMIEHICMDTSVKILSITVLWEVLTTAKTMVI